MNIYHPLTENCRFKDITTSTLANFNHGARVCAPNNDLLDDINSTRIVVNADNLEQELRKRVPDDTLFTTTLAYTNAECNTINDECFDLLRTRGAEHTYIFATHSTSSPSGLGADELNDIKQISLLSVKNKAYDSPFLRVAIGSRMRITSNIATQLGTCKLSLQAHFIRLLHMYTTQITLLTTGLYQGAVGTVHAIQYSGTVPLDRFQPLLTEGLRRPIPIIFLQMDSYKGQSCSNTVPNLVPFAAQISKSKIDKKYYRTQIPLAPAHASTVHKYQGTTAHHALVLHPPEGRNAPRGLVYVMTSRPTKLEDIYLMRPLRMDHFNLPSYRHKIKMITDEYNRLEQGTKYTDDQLRITY